jgi:site-specific DNA-cytosine methylase
MDRRRRVPLRVLDLFSGMGSITKAFRSQGHSVDSLGLDPRFEPSICVNVLDWKYKQLSRGYYDVIWASCLCENYSIARSTAARDLMLADSLVLRTQEIIDWLQPKHWLIENPAGSHIWKGFHF